MYSVENITCPGCGARVRPEQKTCEDCNAPVIITKISDIATRTAQELTKYSKSYEKALAANGESAEICNSLAVCYLQLGLYGKALERFDKAIEMDFNNPDTFLYAAVCVLKGRKPFLCSRPEINKAEEYINAGLMAEENAMLRVLQAYVKYDYYSRKRLNTEPNYNAAFNYAQMGGASSEEIDNLFDLLKQSRPDFMY